MKVLTYLSLFLLALKGPVWSEETQGVVVTIKPLHSLVSAVIGETGKASLLLENNTSPHDFQLKPSQLKILHRAKTVFYIDNQFETFLPSALRTLPEHIRLNPIMKKVKMNLHEQRLGGGWETHHCQLCEEEAEKKNHDHHKEGALDNADMHVWLDPNNAKSIVQYIAEDLSILYPGNRTTYLKNAKLTIEKLEQLDKELKLQLKDLEEKAYIVFHDAYQYFEKAYNLKAVGSITFEPNESPSPKRIQEVRNKLIVHSVKCIFREPQFSDRLVKVVLEGSNTNSATLDPLGADLEIGEDLYFNLLKNLARNLRQGLKQELN